MPLLQSHRAAAIGTPLGDDVLVLRSFTGEERVSRPFRFEAEVLSENFDVAPEDIVGKPVAVRLEEAERATRHFHGIVNRLVHLTGEGEYARYRLEIVPWLWLTTLASDCRIFQELSVPDIVNEVLKPYGGDVELRLNTTYKPRTYCVQYRETDFNFVSRLLEEEGIAYFFEHAEDKHVLVLSDNSAAFKARAGFESLDFIPWNQDASATGFIRGWTRESHLRSGGYAHKDFNHESSRVDLATTEEIAGFGVGDSLQLFDYPGGFGKRADGLAYAKVRMEEIAAQRRIVSGETDSRGLASGCRFDLARHPRESENGAYQIVAVHHQISLGNFFSGGAGSEGRLYQASFEAIPADVVFRPRRLTPRPVVQGPQTAIVVGKKGEEITVDALGRIKVLFHWDRAGKPDANASCWVRVAQMWAGKHWGIVFTPRYGQEVVVDFLEGDPDRPIVTGRVYNDDNQPPLSLPSEATKSTLKTSTSPGGKGFNEIRFEDKDGSQQVFIHAEKNLDLRVKNDAFEWEGNNHHHIVKNDQFAEIGNDRHDVVKRDVIAQFGRDHHLTIKGKQAVSIAGTQSIKVTGDVGEEFDANQSTKVAKNLYIKAENIVIEASTNITLNVGQSFIAIEAGGIKIGTTGDIILDAKKNIQQTATMNWTVDATMNAEIAAKLGMKFDCKLNTELAGLMTTLKGTAMTTVKGGVVMIN